MGTNGDKAAAALCSVVVVVEGRPRATERTIRMVLGRSSVNVEVIAVDNAAAEPAALVLQQLGDEHDRVSVVRSRERQPAGAAWNLGAAAATGHVLVFLSNTTAVEDDWLPPLLRRLEGGAAAVQPRVFAPDGTILTTGLGPGELGHLFDLFRGCAGDEAGAAVTAPRVAATPHCFATTAPILQLAGGFTPELPGPAAVADLCLRLDNGAESAVEYEPASCVVAQPPRAGPRQDRQSWQHFDDRWGDALRRRAHEHVKRPEQRQTAARTNPRPLRWAIKIAAPFARRQRWGDFHFAAALRSALMRLGQDVVVDAHEAWYRATTEDDDVVLVLRGLEEYRPQDLHLNLMWVISHVDEVPLAECETYDHVFVATTRIPDHLRPSGGRVEPLLQATDPTRFHPGPREADLHADVLFVGNSRWQLRPIVRDALAAGLPLSVYGDGWTAFLPPGTLRADLIPNAELPRYYRSAGVVLNDHWDDMRRHGLLSNRLFDLAACGVTVVTDAVEGLAAVFGDAVHSYSSAEELGPLVRRLLAEPPDEARRMELADRMRTDHSFDARARRILEVAREMHARRAAGDDHPRHDERAARA